ncbi:hypothetical protein CEXT_143811 [Caerostris extrusa]|uniref:Uncharacterized protein n=1 Tax=Caerostris extrusa TaxID=172846 RepID=A0AAV4Y3Y3_CAEEX|nr:hypothetical protein CEXT_143811 [Caerostris extrusa]
MRRSNGAEPGKGLCRVGEHRSRCYSEDGSLESHAKEHGNWLFVNHSAKDICKFTGNTMEVRSIAKMRKKE